MELERIFESGVLWNARSAQFSHIDGDVLVDTQRTPDSALLSKHHFATESARSPAPKPAMWVPSKT